EDFGTDGRGGYFDQYGEDFGTDGRGGYFDQYGLNLMEICIMQGDV
nr:hypothetical protein [Tanacetum cinerariifolium]